MISKLVTFVLLSGGEEPNEIDVSLAGPPEEHIPHVYFKQYLPVSNKVIATACSNAYYLLIFYEVHNLQLYQLLQICRNNDRPTVIPYMLL